MSIDPVEREVATAFSLVVGLADNMQITLQSGFTEDEPESAVNARLDRLVALAKRQRAIAEIPAIEDEIIKQKDTLAQFQEDLARVNADHDRLQAQRRVELSERILQQEPERRKREAEINGDILKIQEHRQVVFNAGLAEHQKSGRMGAYEPRGTVKTNLANIDAGIKEAGAKRAEHLAEWDEVYQSNIETAQVEIDRADAEAVQARKGLDISIQRYVDAIAASEEKLAKARAAAGG
jgi:hypothetical protein